MCVAGFFVLCVFLFVFSVIWCAGVPWHVEVHFLSWCSLVAAHFIRGIIASPSSIPSCDREYSTRGGISAKDSLFMSFSVWSSFSVSERVFGLIPFNCFIRSLNRSVPWLRRALMIRSAHFLPIMSMIPLRGQKQRWLHLLVILLLPLWIVAILL